MKSKFNYVSVRVHILAKDGNIRTSEYEDKIKEAIIQAGIEVEKEKLK